MTHRVRGGPFGDTSTDRLMAEAARQLQLGGFSRRTMLRGTGVAGMTLGGSSLLAACGTEGAQIESGECQSTDVSDEEKSIVFSNWIGYVDPVKRADTSTLEKFQEETGITVEYQNGDVNDNES